LEVEKIPFSGSDKKNSVSARYGYFEASKILMIILWVD